MAQTILYVKESTSGEYVGKSYTVDLSKIPVVIEDGDANFSPTEIQVNGTQVIAFNDHFRVICEVVGTIEEPK